MSDLNFEYCDRTGDSVATFHGLKLRAINDSDARNPWEEWDMNVPLVTYSSDRHGGNGLKAYDTESGVRDLCNPFTGDTISDAMLRRHLPAICAAFGDVADVWNAGNVQSFKQWLESEATESQRNYGGSLTDIKRDLLSDAIGDMVRNSERLETLATIYKAIGWPALCTHTSGYSQGDYIELLFVVTPAFRKATGNASNYDWQRDMQGARRLFGAWAWGDVYGYVISDATGETLESCFGYYGSDFEESGLSESALSMCNYILSNARNARNATLKTLIKNRVPLHLRAPLLVAAATVTGV